MEWDRNTGDNVDEQKFSLDRHSQSSDALLSWLTVISIELTKRQRVPFLTGCKKHRLTRVTPEDIGLDRVYIILSSSLSLSLIPSSTTMHIVSLSFSSRVWRIVSRERERERSGEKERERGRQTKKERKKKEKGRRDRRWCARSTRITGLRRDQDLSFFGGDRMDGWTRTDRTVPTRRLIDRFENLGDHSEDLLEHLLVDRVQIISVGLIFTHRPNSLREYNKIPFAFLSLSFLSPSPFVFAETFVGCFFFFLFINWNY